MLAVSNIANIVSQMSYTGLAVLRGYAISGRKKIWKSILISLYLLAIVINILAIWLSLPCGADPTSRRQKAVSDINLVTSILLSAIEGIILGILLVQVRTEFRGLERDLENPAVSLVNICKQQSIILFGSVLISGIVDGVLSPVFAGTTKPAIFIFLDVLGVAPVILSCRFFLELRKTFSHPNGSLDNSNRLPWSSFRAVVRSLDARIMDEFGDHSSYRQTPERVEDVGSVPRPSQQRSRSPSVVMREEYTYQIEEIEEAPVHGGDGF